MQNHRAPPITLRVLCDARLFLDSTRGGKPGLNFSSANRLNQNEPKHVAVLLHVRVRSPANAPRPVLLLLEPRRLCRKRGSSFGT